MPWNRRLSWWTAQVAALAGVADYVDALAAHHGVNLPGRGAAEACLGLQTAHEQALLVADADALDGVASGIGAGAQRWR